MVGGAWQHPSLVFIFAFVMKDLPNHWRQKDWRLGQMWLWLCADQSYVRWDVGVLGIVAAFTTLAMDLDDVPISIVKQ